MTKQLRRAPSQQPMATSAYLGTDLNLNAEEFFGRSYRAHAATFENAADRKPEDYTKPFCEFLTENPTVFHTVGYVKDKLSEQGYEEISPRVNWNGLLRPGGKYYVTRNGSAIIAFKVGASYKPGDGIAMVAGHIDAVTARLKPVSRKPNKAGYVELGVAPYAGALNELWWDRDLSIGGRVIVRDETGKTKSELVTLDWPIARIPTLAPHFGRGFMGSNNKETELVPIIGLESSTPHNSENAAPLGPAGSFINSQPPRLVKLIASELGLRDAASIVNWELELYDSQPAQTGGLDREFIFGGRIDDKLCSWAALVALLESSSDDDESAIKLVALFDDEEIGSLLRQGARSNFLPSVSERIVEALCDHHASKSSSLSSSSSPYGPGIIGQTFARSFLMSADVIHAVNPNFIGAYMEDHMPQLNVGITMSCDSNGHMTTDAVSAAITRRVGELGGGTVQLFQIRNDSRSGGTVGPVLSSAMGVRAVDVGMAQLSMHSIRATTGAKDPGLGVQFFRTFLDKWEKIDSEWQ